MNVSESIPCIGISLVGGIIAAAHCLDISLLAFIALQVELIVHLNNGLNKLRAVVRGVGNAINQYQSEGRGLGISYLVINCFKEEWVKS